LTSVRRNRLKTLKVVEGSPDKSLQIDQPLIFVSALRNEMINKASQGRNVLQTIYKNHYLTSVRRNSYKSLNVVEGSLDKCLQTDQPLIFVGAQ
ncbi:hypothetical protein T07_10921, partial [Trichinella nelsoni]